MQSLFIFLKITGLMVILAGCHHPNHDSDQEELTSTPQNKGGLFFRIVTDSKDKKTTFKLSFKNLETGEKYKFNQKAYKFEKKDHIHTLPVGIYALDFVRLQKDGTKKTWRSKNHPKIYIQKNKLSNLGIYKIHTKKKKLKILHQVTKNYYKIPQKNHLVDIDVIYAFTGKKQTTLKTPSKIKTEKQRPITSKALSKKPLPNSTKSHNTVLNPTKVNDFKAKEKAPATNQKTVKQKKKLNLKNIPKKLKPVDLKKRLVAPRKVKQDKTILETSIPARKRTFQKRSSPFEEVTLGTRSTKTAPMIDAGMRLASPETGTIREEGDMGYQYKRSIMLKYWVDLGKNTKRHGREMVNTLQENDGKIRGCYQKRLDTGSNIRGSMRMKFAYDGKIREIHNLKNKKGDLLDGKLSRCLVDTIGKLEFRLPRRVDGLIKFKFDYKSH